MRLIDIDAQEKMMSDLVQGDIRNYPYKGETWELAFGWLDHAPTIAAVPVVRGKWVYSNPLTDTLVCSECDWNIPGEEFVTNFCPNCGADMREDMANNETD